MLSPIKKKKHCRLEGKMLSIPSGTTIPYDAYAPE
jgi:hypothetical protein